jgi:membrane-associated phospholipid phosphatase
MSATDSLPDDVATLKAMVIAAVVIGLIGANFHFLSDCIAGAFLGASTGWIVVMLWERAAGRGSDERRARGQDNSVRSGGD